MEQLFALTGTPIYISLTHEPENRFGGGNGSDVGLKEDGKVLLEALSGRGTAIDMAHTSDALAHDILNHIEAKGLDLRILASHSNFRPVTNHKRNLPDELTREIIKRGGLIGLNFVRDFVDPNDSERLYEHIRYAVKSGAGDNLAWGADFFSTTSLPAKYQDRMPIFHPEHNNASVYPTLLDRIQSDIPQMNPEKLCFENFLRFIGK
jgi:microsomal dipeptidase-like Zn-dependent dipeptidase